MPSQEKTFRDFLSAEIRSNKILNGKIEWISLHVLFLQFFPRSVKNQENIFGGAIDAS